MTDFVGFLRDLGYTQAQNHLQCALDAEDPECKPLTYLVEQFGRENVLTESEIQYKSQVNNNIFDQSLPDQQPQTIYFYGETADQEVDYLEKEIRDIKQQIKQLENQFLVENIDGRGLNDEKVNVQADSTVPTINLNSECLSSGTMYAELQDEIQSTLLQIQKNEEQQSNNNQACLQAFIQQLQTGLSSVIQQHDMELHRYFDEGPTSIRFAKSLKYPESKSCMNKDIQELVHMCVQQVLDRNAYFDYLSIYNVDCLESSRAIADALIDARKAQLDHVRKCSEDIHQNKTIDEQQSVKSMRQQCQRLKEQCQEQFSQSFGDKVGFAILYDWIQSTLVQIENYEKSAFQESQKSIQLVLSVLLWCSIAFKLDYSDITFGVLQGLFTNLEQQSNMLHASASNLGNIYSLNGSGGFDPISIALKNSIIGPSCWNQLSNSYKCHFVKMNSQAQADLRTQIQDISAKLSGRAQQIFERQVTKQCGLCQRFDWSDGAQDKQNCPIQSEIKLVTQYDVLMARELLDIVLHQQLNASSSVKSLKQLIEQIYRALSDNGSTQKIAQNVFETFYVAPEQLAQLITS